MKPLFSIITCTKNSGKYLASNIDSVKKQKYENYEHIFIDGYSKDRTIETIKRYKKIHSRSVRLFMQKPKGISYAMNQGVIKAKGEYIINLHSDDSFFDGDVLKDVAIFLKNNSELDWIYGKIAVVEEDRKRVGIFPKHKIFQIPNYNLLKFYNYIPHQAVFIKKEVFDRYGDFDETISSQMDLDLWLRIANETRCKFIDREISHYMIRSDAQSSGLKRTRTNKENVVKVRLRYLNKVEMFIFSLVNPLIDIYNETRR